LPRRLAPKLILALALIVLIVKMIALYVNVSNQQARLLESMTLGADQLSRSITAATWQMMLADRRDAAYSVMRTIALKQGIDRIRMFNRDGELMFSTAPGEPTLVDKRAEVCTPCHASATPLVKVDVPNRARAFRERDGRRKLAMITPIYNEPSCSYAPCHAHPANLSVLGVLDLQMNLSRVDQEINSLRMRTLLLSVLEVAFIGLFIVFFTRRFVGKPIRKLIRATKAISEMQLDKPISIESSEELDDLAHSFDLMRQRLKQAMSENAEFTHQLEAKVQERTSQLEAAHQRLIRTDRLASLGQLAASVAHEINNPISGVLNLSMLMQRIVKDDGIPPGRIEEFRRYLSQVSAETSRVGKIVSDLLSFSRRSRPQRSAADLNVIVQTTVSLVAHKLQLAGVQTRFQLAEDLPQVRCDESQIQQVVMNLVLNAAESMHDGGRITIITRRTADRAGVVFEVRDTGAGIPAPLLGRIFDPFFTTKEEGKGVGLGLAVVYGIVQSHGGEIEVESHVGEGSTFRVNLPLSGGEPPAPPPLPPQAGNGI
jgi:two-component system NtrC family sensor kinase